MSHRPWTSRLLRVMAVAGAIIDAVGNAVGTYVIVLLIIMLGYLIVSLLALAGSLVIAVFAAVVLIVFFKGAVGGAPSRAAVRRGGTGLLNVAAGLLPGTAGIRYREEWLGELYDLRAEDASWRSQTGYVFGVLLYVAPRLAITMRLRPTRAVD